MRRHSDISHLWLFNLILYLLQTFLNFTSHVSEIYAEEEYVCTPKSLVIVSVLTLVLINVSMVTGFAIFYRVRKKVWKNGDSSGHNITPVTVPEVLFRSVYGHLSPGPSFTNLGHKLSTWMFAKAQVLYTINIFYIYSVLMHFPHLVCSSLVFRMKGMPVSNTVVIDRK
jgi:hypothetical protein